jgi:hypothetical protein
MDERRRNYEGRRFLIVYIFNLLLINLEFENAKQDLLKENQKLFNKEIWELFSFLF